MKSPLRYQITEYDCGSVSLLNCLTFLFEREEIPAELVRVISVYALDCYDTKGKLSTVGNNREIVYYVSRWINEFAEQKNIPVYCKYLRGADSTFLKIRACLKAGGCVSMKTYHGDEHYVTLTAIDDEYVYLFDPYFKAAEDYRNNKYIEYIAGMPFSFNRRVRLEYFLSEKRNEFSMGPIEKREALLFRRNDALLEHSFS